MNRKPGDSHHAFEVWTTRVEGGMMMEEFPSLEEAVAFVRQHEDIAALAIKYPNGEWHRLTDLE